MREGTAVGAVRALLPLVLVAACYRGGGPAPATPPEPPQRVRTAADPLAFLPADSELVVSIDAAQLRASMLWERIETTLRLAADDMLAAFLVHCGYDPVASVTRVTAGLRSVRARPVEGVMVLRGVDRDQTLKCLAELRDPRITIHGAFATLSYGEVSILGFATAQTLVVLTGRQASEQALARILDGGAPLRATPWFRELFGFVQTSEALWFVLGASGFGQNATLGIRPLALLGAANLANGFTGTLRVRLETPDMASNLVALAQSQSATAKQVLEEFEATAEDADVVVRLSMTQTQLDAVLTMLGWLI
jgi:hypothetical protein